MRAARVPLPGELERALADLIAERELELDELLGQLERAHQVALRAHLALHPHRCSPVWREKLFLSATLSERVKEHAESLFAWPEGRGARREEEPTLGANGARSIGAAAGIARRGRRRRRLARGGLHGAPVHRGRHRPHRGQAEGRQPQVLALLRQVRQVPGADPRAGEGGDGDGERRADGLHHAAGQERRGVLRGVRPRQPRGVGDGEWERVGRGHRRRRPGGGLRAGSARGAARDAGISLLTRGVG